MLDRDQWDRAWSSTPHRRLQALPRIGLGAKQLVSVHFFDIDLPPAGDSASQILEHLGAGITAHRE
jgi:hypothetical protein